MSQTMPLEAVPASPTDVDEAPWCRAHWGDLALRSGEEAPEGQGLGGTSPNGASGPAASPVPRGLEGPR